MKKFLLVLLLPLLGFGQLRDSVYVKTDIYEVMYSETLEQPLWVKYQVMCTGAGASRKGMDFYTNDSIITSDNADYENNIYDKGHLAPAADFTCSREMLYKTFSYLNCALQDQYLNRGTWRLLESFERNLAVAAPGTKVEIVLEFKNKTKLPTGATVPSGFYKRITSGGKVYMYYFQNVKPLTSDYTKYQITTWPKKVN